jgi:hypothetical protein
MLRFRPPAAARLLFAVVSIAVVSTRVAAAAAEEIGRPILRHYTPGEHLQGIQSSRVTQDATGTVFFSNGVDLLSFDGARWKAQLLSSTSVGIRQFTTAEDGTLYFAGGGVIGYLKGDGADAKFISLAPQLPPSARNIDDLRYAAALGPAVYFSDSEKILAWHGGRFTEIPFASPPEGHGARLHRVGDRLYVTALTHGLGRITGDDVETVSGDPLFHENQVVRIEAGPVGTLILLTTERGFFQLAPDGRVTRLATEMNRWIISHRIFCARRLTDGSWVVGFSAASGDGGLRFAPDGHYAGPLDTTIGLVVKTIRDFFQDREGGLWLGMDIGAARLEWPSPISLFDSVNGLGQGAVTDVVRRDGTLYAATSEGFFRLVPSDDSGRGARFERVPPAAILGLPELFRRAESDPPRRELAQNLSHFARATLGELARVREETGPAGTILWICGANGLARIEGTPAPLPPVPYAVQLHATNVRGGDHLPTRAPPVSFTFVAARQRPTSPVTYQTRLVGLEDEPTGWSAQRERIFTNLSPGDYRFEVRARDTAGELAKPAAIAFTVLAPWWRTPWAFVGYTLAGLGLIAGVVRIRTHSLHVRAAQLEATVAERTAELAHKNAELIRLNRLELDEKISARLGEEKSRLEVLRYQLNPHFLFNTLASISSSLPPDRSVARTMVERLAEFCRLTLHRTDERDWTTLGGEMKLLRAYFDIEQSRWGELLDVTIACDPALESERLPHFLLLPLVENALKYGRATSRDRVGIRLLATREPDGALRLEVANTGEWIEPTEKKKVSSLGIGLDNLRERLARYYPRSHQLVHSQAGGWVTVVLRIRPPVVS